jgi:hypothetical protein
MLTLTACPYCAMQVPADGAFCDSCGRQFAACPTCSALTRGGEKCIADGSATVLRPPFTATSSASATTPAAAPVVAAPTVVPPPRRAAAPPPAPPPAQQVPTSSGIPAVSVPTPAAVPHVPVPTPSPAPVAPQHAAFGTTVQPLSRKLRLIVTSGESLPPLEVEHDTVVGRAEGPFAMLLDPFHNKGLSRRHCQFRRTPTGDWVIVDLAGRDSTFVSTDGRFTTPVAQNATAVVDPARALLRLGELQFRVEGIA